MQNFLMSIARTEKEKVELYTESSILTSLLFYFACKIKSTLYLKSHGTTIQFIGKTEIREMINSEQHSD